MPKIVKKYGKITLILGLILAILGIYMAIPISQAASATLEKDTISDSRPTILANHDIKFKMDAATTIVNAETVTVKFNGFTEGATPTVIADWLVLWDADGVGTYTALTRTTDFTFLDPGAVADPTYQFTFTTTGATAIGANKYIEITFTNGAGKLPNPAAGVDKIDIGGTFGDTGVTYVAIITGVTVSATISESLSSTVALVTDANCPTTGGTKVTTTATTVPFGTINTETFYDGCQSLTVSTNAATGYSATVQENDQLTSGSDQIPDGTCDAGGCSDTTEAAWATATNNGFAYCMKDVTGDAAATADVGWATVFCGASPQNFKTIADAGAAEAAQAIMSSAVPATGDNATIGYRLSADAAQQPGTYTNTISYIVTPTY